MPREALSTDVTTMPDLAHIAREVARTGKRRVLTENGAVLAVVSPARAPRRGKVPSQADIAAALSAAGSWKELVDAEQLKRDLDAARGSDSSPVER